MARPAKTLAELYRDGSFRWSRHRHLLRDRLELDAIDIATIIERDRQGFPSWTTAALLRLTVGAVTNVLLLHKRTVAP